MTVVVRIAGSLEAVIWLVCLPLVALSSFAATTGQVYLTGACCMGAGLLLIPLASSLGARSSDLRKNVVRVTGCIVGVVTCLAGMSWIVALLDVFGRVAPVWLLYAPLTAVVLVVLWIAGTSVLLLGSPSSNRTLYWTGIIPAAAAVAYILFTLGMSLLNLTYTNLSMVPLLLPSVLIWGAVPTWFLSAGFSIE